MKLIIGLGNPGEKYQNTRHNLGQFFIKQFVEKQLKGSFVKKPKLFSQIYETVAGLPADRQGADKKIFAIPTEYMNNSGLTIKKLTNFYKVLPKDIYIVHDDLDLETGDSKIQFDRGPAGHNGIKSIIENLGTQQFNRIRIGIGKPTNKIPIEDYVLKPFSKEEKDKIENITVEILNFIKEI